VLVFTLARFSTDLEQMALAVQLRLGNALDAHRDDRGVFLLPDVPSRARRRTRGMERVVLPRLSQLGFTRRALSGSVRG
jgi:hypothetical protein